MRKQKPKRKIVTFFSGSSFSRGKNGLEGTCDSVFPRFRTQSRCFFVFIFRDVPIQATGTVEHGSCAAYVWHQFLCSLRYL